MRNRLAPVLVVAGALLLLGSYVIYAISLVSELRAHARQSSILYARVYSAIRDTSDAQDGVTVLLDLSRQIAAMNVPTVITDSAGDPVVCVNLPYCDPIDAVRAREAALRFDRSSPPIRVSSGGNVHFGHPPVVQALALVPFLQAGALLVVLVAGFLMFRERARLNRERLWAGMARESAHQIATPLSSLSGWLELLRSGQPDAQTTRAVEHMEADLERLERVAHRFERIGRPPRREPVDVGALAGRVADYFRVRVPTGSHAIAVELAEFAGDRAAVAQGDPVLLEWALEALVKNAIDALAGRSGFVRIAVRNTPEGGVAITVSDNGPGVNRELRSLIFQPGFSTKTNGWGVGLALARRIVEDNHGGTLTLVPTDSGATFELSLK